jgi:hypothetical protein
VTEVEGAMVATGEIHRASAYFKTLPKLIQVVIFIALAATAAMAGTLDDWARVVLAVLFAGVALCLLAEVRQTITEHRASKAPTPEVTP